MALLRRTPRLPASLRGALDLPKGDKDLARTPLASGAWAVATRRALYVLTPSEGDGAPSVRRETWDAVERASFEPDTTTILVTLVRGGVLDLVLDGADWRVFATTLRERVQSSVIHVESVTLPGGVLARASVRRDEEGLLFSHVSTAEPVDTSLPAVARALDELEQRVRSAAGMTP